jgi:hypothetical protein
VCPDRLDKVTKIAFVFYQWHSVIILTLIRRDSNHWQSIGNLKKHSYMWLINTLTSHIIPYIYIYTMIPTHYLHDT